MIIYVTFILSMNFMESPVLAMVKLSFKNYAFRKIWNVLIQKGFFDEKIHNRNLESPKNQTM